ncbi:MAG TPA: hypothetical protein VGZ48_11035 [Candidatus Acidoferrales bacterium]|jgi:hypothetical protein|nr:hypothetical protein [Candidatus Acidoferrales bacterium]
MTGLRKWIIGGLVLAIIVGVYWRLSSRTHVIGEAYVADQSVTLWTTLAQVRQRTGDVHWGDQVEILKRSGGDTFVRTSAGLEGWMDERTLIDSAAWQREVQLQSTSHSIPVQATGHTKVFTNVHLEAARDSTRIYQLMGGVALAIVGHAAIEVPSAPSGTAGTPPKANSKEKGKVEGPKREDWVLVYSLPARPYTAGGFAQPSGGPQTSSGSAPGKSSSQSKQGDMVMGRDPAQRQAGNPVGQGIPAMAGWVLARFVELDLPETLRDYATTAGMRPVAWFVLNYVSDDEEPKPQYLMAGNRGGESGSCDFNSLRVYTFGAARRRYETAFVEGNLCGYFPIRVAKQARTGDPEFRFTSLESGGAKEERVYAMHQTSVRRVREEESPRSSAPAKSAKSPKHR